MNFLLRLFLIVAIAFLLVSLIALKVGRAVAHASEPDRFENISHDGSRKLHDIITYHDKQTGKEYVCFGITNPSCMETGRQWGGNGK